MSDNLPAGEAIGVRQTRFRDVCGSIDEIKRVLYEEPPVTEEQRAALDSLIDDALFMLARMEQRLAEYEAFRAAILAAMADAGSGGGSRRQEALGLAPGLRAQLRAGAPLDEEARNSAVATAEGIRDVAQDIENALSRYKALALGLERAYRTVKGERAWVLDEAEAAAAEAAPGEPEWTPWLPPSPHRERIVRHLRAGRAHLLTCAELAALRGVSPDALPAGETPWVQFGDGGVMALPQVRWSDDIRNFYASEEPPHPNGRRYREYAGRKVRPVTGDVR